MKNTSKRIGVGCYLYRGYKIRRDYSKRQKRTVWKYYSTYGKLLYSGPTLREAKEIIDLLVSM